MVRSGEIASDPPSCSVLPLPDPLAATAIPHPHAATSDGSGRVGGGALGGGGVIHDCVLSICAASMQLRRSRRQQRSYEANLDALCQPSANRLGGGFGCSQPPSGLRDYARGTTMVNGGESSES